MSPPVSPEALAPLRELLSAAGIGADKRFGQHFLLDLNICRKIVRLAGITAGQTVIEVGPGPGGLTRALLESGADIVVVEKDPRFIPLLAELAGYGTGNLAIVEADALEVDENNLVPGVVGAHVVANLPYNVGTPLLVKWLTGPFRPASMTLMFQKEVALRIVAAPGAPEYGRLAVLCQTLGEARIVMELPPRAFTPPPKVSSAVVKLDPYPPDRRPPEAVIAGLQKMTQAAFGQRRKMLRSSLRFLGGEALCLAAGVNPNDRAETVSISGFRALTETWLAQAS